MKRLNRGGWPVVALALLLLISLTLMSGATENSARFGELYVVLLVFNALGLATLGGMIAWNLVKLVHQVRQEHPGARLTARMVTMFIVLAVTPVLVVYFFSLQFLHRGIDSWFDVRIEAALDDALELSRTSLGVRMRELLKQTELIARDLSQVREEATSSALDDARFLSGASELTLMAPRGRIISASSEDPTSIVPFSPDDATLLQVRQSQSYIGLESIGDTGLFVRVVVRVPGTAPTEEPQVLQALFPTTDRMNTLAESVQTAYTKYGELVFLRKSLKLSYTLTLSLVLLLSLFTAVWAALFSARQMVAPLGDLVQGTRAVADGDYELQLPQTSHDELGFLVESFNDMTRKLARARDETRQSQQQVEDQRTYLEAVLSRLSSGVITLDRTGRLVTTNYAAEQVLGVNLQDDLTRPLAVIAEHHPNLKALVDKIETKLAAASEWREQIGIVGADGRKVLMCRGAPLPAYDHRNPGHVVVFDDVTALLQAQRDAAWSEVARRLAHEIKNPLTPIQLSAERLRQKYLKEMDPAEAGLLDRLTRTIVQQVEGLKEMVNAFSEYARSPSVTAEPIDLNDLISDVAELYRSHTSIRVELDSSLPMLEMDPDRIRQILHNLIKNAIEASEGSGTPVVSIITRTIDVGGPFVELEIRDQGSGFPPEILEKVFEPYITTKRKGTGLGLAIVKRIVEENGGAVRVMNNPDGGAVVIMQFPLSTSRGNPSRPRRQSRKEAV